MSANESRAMGVILAAMHEQIRQLQDICLEAQQRNLEALKGMEPKGEADRVKIWQSELGVMRNACGECRCTVSHSFRYCPACGRRLRDDETEK